MPPNHPQQPQIPLIKGPVHGVPCPWCGAKNDFREPNEVGMVAHEADFECDKCHNMMQVVGDPQPVIVVAVRKSPRNAELVRKRQADRAANPRPMPAHTRTILRRPR